MSEDATSLVPEHSIQKQMWTLRSEHPIILHTMQEIWRLWMQLPRFCAQASLVDVTFKDYKYLWSEPCVCPQSSKDTQVSQPQLWVLRIHSNRENPSII